MVMEPILGKTPDIPKKQLPCQKPASFHYNLTDKSCKRIGVVQFNGTVPMGNPVSMHIVQLLPALNQGGVERGTIEFSAGYVQRGHQSTVISAGGRQAPQIEKDGGRHIQLDVASKNPLTVLPRILRLRSLLRQLNPDILHARSRVPAWLAYLANRSLQIPFVTTVHGFNSVNAYSRIMTKGDRVICVSHPVKQYVEQHYRVPGEKITVIHRGIDGNIFDPAKVDRQWVAEMKQKLGLQDQIVVASIGRITPLKDFETFIRAVAMLRTERPEIRGLIVGGAAADKTSYYESLQHLARQLNVDEHILFVGSQERMPEIYTLSHVVVSSSKKPESFGRTLVEAMAMNKPVVATRHGGALDIVRDGMDGCLVPPECPEALANALRQLCRPPPGGWNTRSRVLREFTLEQSIEKTLDVYRNLLQTWPEESGCVRGK